MIVAVIPAIDQPLIGRLVTHCLRYVDDVVVIDEIPTVAKPRRIDTAALAQQAGATGVYSDRGTLAGALALGVGMTTPSDTVLTLDGDGAQSPTQIPHLLDALPRADIVIGSRWMKRGHSSLPIEKRILRWGFSSTCRIRSGIPIRDWGGGFRAYRNGVALDLFDQVTCTGHAYQAELIYLAASSGYVITEVPTAHFATSSTLNHAAIREAFTLLVRMRRVRETEPVLA